MNKEYLIEDLRGLVSQSVIMAISRVPRELFVPEDLESRAYDDMPLPIGLNQTISAPHMVAIMSQQIGNCGIIVGGKVIVIYLLVEHFNLVGALKQGAGYGCTDKKIAAARTEDERSGICHSPLLQHFQI